jgi:hypothetical protein
MKVAFVIAASHSPVYNNFKASWLLNIKKWMEHPLAKEHELIFIFSYEDGNNKSHQYKTHTDIYWDIPSDVYRPNKLEKTIATYNYINKMCPDYTIKTNLSTAFHFGQLVNWLSNKPRLNFVSGVYIGGRIGLSGTCIIHTHDILQFVLTNAGQFTYRIPEDVDFSRYIMFNYKNYQSISVNRIDFAAGHILFHNCWYNDPVFCFRFKSHGYRDFDTDLMRKFVVEINQASWDYKKFIKRFRNTRIGYHNDSVQKQLTDKVEVLTYLEHDISPLCGNIHFKNISFKK